MTKKSARHPTEEEIDKIVADQADDQSKWEEPIHVKKPTTASLTIPSDLAARAAFLARLHGSSAPNEWVARIIRERVELEEVALGKAKRELSAKRTRAKPANKAAKNHR
jgi:hypothetical protein